MVTSIFKLYMKYYIPITADIFRNCPKIQL